MLSYQDIDSYAKRMQLILSKTFVAAAQGIIHNAIADFENDLRARIKKEAEEYANTISFRSVPDPAGGYNIEIVCKVPEE